MERNSSDGRKDYGELGDESLIRILSFLPSKDAFKATLFNKRWSKLLKEVCNVDFAFELKEGWTLENESDVFDKFLGCLNPSTDKTKFSVQFHCNPLDILHKLDSWVIWAVNQPVKTIELEIKTDPSDFNQFCPLPAILFQCESLVQLKLCNSELNISNLAVSLPLLKDLDLHGMLLDEMNFSHLIDSCPLLVRLSLVRCWFRCIKKLSAKIRIRSPSLRCLKIWNCHVSDKCIMFKITLPSLVAISININSEVISNAAILNCAKLVQKVHVGPLFLEELSDFNIKASSEVTHLEMELPVMYDDLVQGMRALVSSYSNLQTLIIKFNFIKVDTRLRGQFSSWKALQTCLSNMVRLKTFHVHGLTDLEVMALAKGKYLPHKPPAEVVSGALKLDYTGVLGRGLKRLKQVSVFVATEDCSNLALISRLKRYVMLLLEETEAFSSSVNIQVTSEPKVP